MATRLLTFHRHKNILIKIILFKMFKSLNLCKVKIPEDILRILSADFLKYLIYQIGNKFINLAN